MSNPQQPNDSETLDEALVQYTADLMAGLNQAHFPREQQAKIFLKCRRTLASIIQDEILKARKDQTFKVIQKLVKAGVISDHAASTALAVYTSQLNQPNTNKEEGL